MSSRWSADPMLIRQTLLYLPAQLIGPALQLFAAVIWTHWLTPDAYGALLFLIAGQELISVICLSWWSYYTLRYLGAVGDAEGQRRYLASEGSVLAMTSIVQTILAVLVLATLSIKVTPELIAATVLYTLTRSAIAHLSERARASSRIELYTFAQTAGPALGFVLAFSAIVFIAPTAENALFGFAIAQAISLLFLGRAMHLSFGSRTLDRETLERALRFGIPLVIAGVVGWISVNGIRVIINETRGAEAMGLVSVGWSLGQRLAVTMAMLVTAAAFPLAVKHLHDGSREESLRQLANSGALLFALLLPTSVGLVLVTPHLIALTIAKPFQAVTVAVLPIAVIAGSLRNMRLHFSDQAFLLFERTDLATWVNGFEAVAVILFCLIGLAVDGIVGAAAGCLAGSFLGAIAGMSLSRLRFGLIIPWGHVARITIATAVMALVVVLTPDRDNASILPLVLKVGDGIIAYAVTLFVLYPSFRRSLRHLSVFGGAVT
ncbi:lipopolysaccharide biosynthesis protein [Methyloferula stellata]|uniref:lipopolysaccharide biosynthesis protein n=1 Tax=Methyloferula stellata TaxID=876270 RepID=UPI0012691739|nr:oligosaccharide flippase family protein [Methyloferula stellata]